LDVTKKIEIACNSCGNKSSVNTQQVCKELEAHTSGNQGGQELSMVFSQVTF
jgi:hypothetical protein